MISWHQDDLHSHCHKQSCHHMKSEIATTKKSYSESDCDKKLFHTNKFQEVLTHILSSKLTWWHIQYVGSFGSIV